MGTEAFPATVGYGPIQEIRVLRLSSSRLMRW